MPIGCSSVFNHEPFYLERQTIQCMLTCLCELSDETMACLLSKVLCDVTIDVFIRSYAARSLYSQRAMDFITVL